MSPLPPSPTSPPMAAERREKTLQGKYELGRLLGRGAFAKVYLAREISTSKPAAVKCINKQNILDHGLSANVSREISILRRLRHPHIISLAEVLASKSTIYFIMELAKGGELFSKLAAGRLSEDHSRRIFHQLISAVGYCHSRGVFHRDLKPENLLLDENGDLKITDFGLSAVSEKPYKDHLLHTLCGTPAYVPPEILAKKEYFGAMADLWSCGIILFVLAAGYLPFNDANLMAMYRKIIRGELRFPRWFSPELKHLVSRLLDTNPKSRITVEEISRDAWFRKGLNVERWKEMTFFGRREEKMGKWEEREVNAFDIISLSSGLDLSGLLGKVEGKERVVMREKEEAAGEMIERVGRREKLEVRRWGERGARMTMEGGGRRLVAVVDVRRIGEEILMVEVERGRDCSPDFDGFWEKKMMPFLESLRRGGSSSTVGL